MKLTSDREKLNMMLFSRKEVFSSTFPVNQSILEEKISTKRRTPLEKELQPNFTPFKLCKTPFEN